MLTKNTKLFSLFNHKLFNKFNNLTKLSLMKFGGGHGEYPNVKKGETLQNVFDRPYHKNHYDNNHLAHHHEESSETLRFDASKYVRTLNKQQRIEENQKVFMVDDELNPPTDHFAMSMVTFYSDPNNLTSVMVPYKDKLTQLESSILDDTEIKARIYNLLRQFDYMDLKEFDFSKDYEKDLGLDSLDWTAILTSIEYEFNTAFNDTFYEHWRTIDEVVQHLSGDPLIY